MAPPMAAPRIHVEEGDISEFDGNAVVNAANNRLLLGAGVAGALARRGGPSIQRECDEHVHRHGPLSVGEAALTGGGSLPARYVIHAAAMGDEPATANSIRSSTRHALRLATDHEFDRIAFPVLGTGVAGFPFEEAALIMLDEIRAHAVEHSWPREYVLFGYTAPQADALRTLIGTETRSPGLPSAGAP